jgi:hypothetical protein
MKEKQKRKAPISVNKYNTRARAWAMKGWQYFM